MTETTRTLFEAESLLSRKGFKRIRQQTSGVEQTNTYGSGVQNEDGSYPVLVALRDYGDGFWTITTFKSSDKEEMGRLHEIKLALMKLPRFERRPR
jgi:hypothetical protein